MIPPDCSPFSLAGRVALVTGSTTGLGKAMTIALGRAGARVAINYQNNTVRAEAAFAGFKAAGGDGRLLRGDVTSESEVPRLVDEIANSLGPVDILVLNATPLQPLKPIEQYDWGSTSRCWISLSKARSCSARRACLT